ncbi:MAG: hypothetical protein C0606_15695 [Hyphomicrobiales bacterium]|mgnify:CR=1 FL=1|nr:MAG: hypothetical protein C0606_15695 [Hyphomicrobiales bacterium]
MIKKASLLPALAFAAVGFGPALAGDIVNKAIEVENSLQNGQPVAALTAAEAVYDATWTAMPLSFAKATFTDGAADGYGRFTARESNVFSPSDQIMLYAEPLGYGYGETDKGFAIDLDADLELRTAGGQILAAQKDVSRLSHVSARPERAFHLSLSFVFEGLSAGDYVVAITLRDAHSDKSGAFELPFTVDSGKPKPRPGEGSAN